MGRGSGGGTAIASSARNAAVAEEANGGVAVTAGGAAAGVRSDSGPLDGDSDALVGIIAHATVGSMGATVVVSVGFMVVNVDTTDDENEASSNDPWVWRNWR